MKHFKATFFILLILSVLLVPDIVRAGCAFGRGKPQAECAGWIVFNSGWLQRFAGKVESYNKSRYLLNFDLGFMKNISDTRALGGSFYLGADDDGSDFGVMARYKKFITPVSSYEFCGGLILAGDDNYLEKRFPGFIFQASISLKDWIAVTFQSQITRFDRINYTYYNYQSNWESYSGTQTEFYLGMRLGSYAALIIPTAITIIVATMIDDWD